MKATSASTPLLLTVAAVLSPSFPAAPFSFTPHNKMGSSHSKPSVENTALSSVDRASDSSSSVDGISTNNGSSHPKQQLSQEHEPYTPPSSPIHPSAHYVFLVHGWLGNDLEMGYLSDSFGRCVARERGEDAHDELDESLTHDAKRVKRSPSQIAAIEAAKADEEAEARVEKKKHHPPIVVHSVKYNVGKTHDGIKKGGTRLAHEIVDFIRDDLQQSQNGQALNGHTEKLENGHESVSESNNQNIKDGHITYSIVGNSLGGLYARYAISLLPRQLSIPRPINNTTNSNAHQQRITLHPNTFITTATPHLGVSQHTYLPIPRIAETIIGSGMGETGKDLFRLNSDKVGRENVIGAGVRRISGRDGLLSPNSWKIYKGSSDDDDGDDNKNVDSGSSNGDNNSNNVKSEEEQLEQETECIIRNMCLQEKYLTPLRNFKKRIAYANAYRTDFQVPTETAAFLNEESNVKHVVIAAREVGHRDNHVNEEQQHQQKQQHERDEAYTTSTTKVPPFIVAILQTKQQPTPPNQNSESKESTTSQELLQMSQSLDALGWTKIFIDVRNRIPLPGIPKPSWRLLPFPSVFSTMFPEPDTSLDDLIHSRGFKANTSQQQHPTIKGDPNTPKVTTLTSSELISATNAGQSLHFPMGHTVMVANSKSETYTKLNWQGRPVMDWLCEDLLGVVLEFE